ncbi:MAG: AAA family ATPase [Candidatus Nanopelagicales bacterium]|nr:AAA family ATPase [Candidatus Nanopelagicales bacterium]
MTDLRRHVPPLTLTWDQEVPGSRWRVVDGTLVFADVSGFTALTERLSRRGRIGAEEIVETLNRVFGPMLRIAAGRGGELLKFGGDALLFLFRGPDHTEQACDAAVEMRAALRAAAAVPTSVGRLSLSMSVGVHAGDIHLFLVGEPTRELLVLGPGATATAQAEQSAEAGEIVVSEATAARLPADAVRPRADGRLLLRRRRPRTLAPGAAALPPADDALLRSLFPQALGEYLGPAIPDPEHRMACIAFIRFSGTDALLAGPGPDALAEALHATVTLVEEALAPERVTLLATDLDRDGGKCFLGSGIPTAFDDNEGRMLRALRRIADSDSPLPLQLGVHRGHVFAAEVGIPERGAYTGMGDTTNTAARIMGKAGPGLLYAHPAVLEHARTRFAVTPAGPFPMKGKTVPLLVYEVGEELGTREEAPADTVLPFLGRDAEVAAARGAMARALGGAGGVLTVVGGTGLGKTRLVAEALTGVEVDHRIVVRSEPYGAASPYRVLRDPLRALLRLERDTPAAMGQAMLAALRQVAPDLLPMAPLLADVAQVEVPSTAEVDQLDPQYRPERLADAVIELVARAMPGRIVLIAEESHWADAASAALLERVALAATGRPWTVVAIRRPDPGGFAPSVGETIEVGPLPPAVVERLVIAATEATPLRPHEIAAIVERAEGSPLFVTEVTRVALTAGSLEALPESVGAAMATQIDALPPHARRILRYCAVLGRSFRLAVLREVLSAEGLALQPADVAELSGFLEPDGPARMRFRNSLVRDAAYEGLAFRIRARMHRTAGETLERISTDVDADAPVLALHFWRAGDADRTWTYARRAGEDAKRAYANVDAIEHLERALEVSRRIPGVTDADRASLWATLGELRELAGVLDGSVEAYRRAAATQPDPAARAELMARRARVLERAGSYRAALLVVGRARRIVADLPEAERIHLEARLDQLLAVIRLGQERPVDARRWAARAVTAARASQDLDVLANALMLQDFADAVLGEPGVGEATREALQICIDQGYRPREAVARENLGSFAFFAGQWDQTVQWYAQSRQVATEVGNAHFAAKVDLNLADLLTRQGQLDGAAALLEHAVRVFRASGLQSERAYGELLRARLLLASGELDGAEALAGEVCAQYRAMGLRESALEAVLVAAEVSVRRGDHHEALALLEAEVVGAEQPALLRAAMCLVRGRALAGLGRSPDALAVLGAGLAAAKEQGLPFEEAMLLRARAELSPDGIGAADRREAARILASLGVLQLAPADVSAGAS